MTDFNDPAARLDLIERVGPDEYQRRLAAHIKSTIVEAVAGHDIRKVDTRFGRLFAVGRTGHAFRTIDAARDYANANPA